MYKLVIFFGLLKGVAIIKYFLIGDEVVFLLMLDLGSIHYESDSDHITLCIANFY